MAPSLEKSLKTLAISPDTKAQIYALLEDDKFAESLKLAQSDKCKHVPELFVAYAQYRLGREEDCLRTLGDARDRASLHLRAQALYRLEKVQLQDLAPLKTGVQVDNEIADIEVNEIAIAAQHAALAKPDLQFVPDSRQPSHEYLFNKSVLLSSQGHIEEARECLNLATQSLDSLMLEQSDYDAEIAPIYAQMAHLTSDVARNREAQSKKTDSLTQFLTGINFLEAENPYLLYKAYQAESRLKSSARLFSFQDRFVAYDKIVVMHTIGLSIKKAVQKYIARFSVTDPERCSALSSLMYAKTTKESLERRLKSNSSDVDAAVALLSKTIRGRKGTTKAIEIIKQISPTVRNQNPGLISLWCALSDLTALSDSNDIIESALQEATGAAREELLAGSIQRSLSLSKSESTRNSSVLHERVKELVSLNPNNLVGQSAQLIISTSDVEEEALRLPDLSSIDVNQLESGLKRTHDAETSYSLQRPLSTPSSGIKRVKRKTVEEIEAESKLDPERWLPKRDRSNYKPTKKEKARPRGGGHQGGVVDESLSSMGPAQNVSRAGGSGEASRKKKGKKGK